MGSQQISGLRHRLILTMVPAESPVTTRDTIRPMKTRQLTAIIERDDDVYVALCPELDIASQGKMVEAARANLVEALDLFFESFDPSEVLGRVDTEIFVTQVEVAVG